ncbi:YeiH family protein [Pseudoduganella violaceinigra]|uniref:YeiH family protein n=1 Tax=Pseudoduganella violaceinigra TaxID=246602 RepID=UPI00041296B7|nr:putative sulfate exporter family transporter [Pseudoduganella violaceinigra]
MKQGMKFMFGAGTPFVLAAAATMALPALGLGRYGISALTLALLAGALLGNLLPALSAAPLVPGLRFVQRRVLRLGVMLYGLNLSVAQIVSAGSRGIWIDLVMVCSTLALGWFVGTRLLGLDRETTLLASAGSAICGAAAIVATAPALKMSEQREVAATASAVAAVIVFGTAAIFIYPTLYGWWGGNPAGFGAYIGSTVHEVAQVVAIGNLIGGDAERVAVIVKMLRVVMLVPFVLFVGSRFAARTSGADLAVPVPWFAFGFLALAGVNSLHWIPAASTDALKLFGTFCLTAAMAALGIDTNLARLRQSGLKVFALGLLLFVHLLVVGGAVNFWFG